MERTPNILPIAIHRVYCDIVPYHTHSQRLGKSGFPGYSFGLCTLAMESHQAPQ